MPPPDRRVKNYFRISQIIFLTPEWAARMLPQPMEDHMADDELSGLDARWPGTTDANVESMARRMMAIDLNTTTDRAGNHAASHPALVNYWRRFSRAAIEHIRDLPDQPAAEPTPVLRDRSHDAVDVARFMQHAREGGPVTEPEPEWRVREKGVMELVGTTTTIMLVNSPSNLIVLAQGDCCLCDERGDWVVYPTIAAAKDAALKYVATRRAFGLDV